MGDVFGDAAEAAIKAQHERLEREWRRVIIEALRPEVGNAAERCADMVIAALSKHTTVWPPVSFNHQTQDT